jgi:hypothetical protein
MNFSIASKRILDGLIRTDHQQDELFFVLPRSSTDHQQDELFFVLPRSSVIVYVTVVI